jgi:hypothetical protein
MSEHLALVQALLTPNLKGSLPIVIMLLMIQGIHPEIIFELIPYVQMTHRQYYAIIIAWTQLRLFASLLPAVKGVKHRSFQDQRTRFRIFPQDRVSRVFRNFQKSVLSRMLKRCGFARTLPSFENVQQFASKLAVVRNSRCPIFPIGQLFSPNEELFFMKIALQMKIMIENVRSSYPEIVSFLAQNENALMNIIMVWRNQVIVKQKVYGLLFDISEPAKINSLFIFCILTVIDPEFIDENLAQFIQNCGDRNKTIKFSYNRKHLDFLEQNCETFEPETLRLGYLGRMIELCIYDIENEARIFNVRYALKPWSMAFGQIVYSGQPQFEEETIELASSRPIFDVFARFWKVFFRNFAATFEVSFLPFGNIRWSEEYTRLCTTNFDWIIPFAVENFALRIGSKDGHAFLRSKIGWMSNRPHSEFTTASYTRLIFPDGIRNCKISSEICSCFLRDFWRTHQKPDPTMSDIDYIRWLFSFPEYAVFGRSWVELMDSLQNGSSVPKIHDESSVDFRYLSFPTVETDPVVQRNYDENFKKDDLQISDYFEVKE